MPQHHRLSKAIRPLLLNEIHRYSEEDAIAFFAEARWGSKDKQECPHCGAVDAHHYRAPQKRWRCKHCHKFFSLTSKTKFADRKISYHDLLIILYKFANPSFNGLVQLQPSTRHQAS